MPFVHTTLRQKWGGDVQRDIQFCLMHMSPLTFLKIFITWELEVDSWAFWKNSSFTEHVPWEITDAFVETNSRGIKATCIIVVTGDNLT